MACIWQQSVCVWWTVGGVSVWSDCGAVFFHRVRSLRLNKSHDVSRWLQAFSLSPLCCLYACTYDSAWQSEVTQHIFIEPVMHCMQPLNKLLCCQQPRVGTGQVSKWVKTRVCVCPRIDPLHFLAGCRSRRLNQGLVVALDFLSVLDRACFV